MDFASNQHPQIKEMLATIGVDSILDLFCDIPNNLLLPSPSTDDGISEYEGLRLMETLASHNTFSQFDNYLGGGAYEHHIPALTQAICQKSEFLTAYTPYQAEASQGMLQSIFEFQSSICALTGMDAANASVYDGANACAEAILMCIRQQKEKKKVLISGALNPFYRGVIDQYLECHALEVITIPFNHDGSCDTNALAQHLDTTTAAVVFQSPNFFGCIEEMRSLSEKAKTMGALVILCANPLSYGLFATPAELGVDIAVGDCQPLGLALNFGGPYAGYVACRDALIRQLPGRIIGETVDKKGERGFVLTLQAREQHIRREKATSNICTNQSLAALASLITMLWYGPEGLKKLASTNYQRAHYLQHALSKSGCIVVNTHFFNEFIVDFNLPIDTVLSHFRTHGIEPGIPLGQYHKQYPNSLLVAVTETKSKEQLDHYVTIANMMRSTREDSIRKVTARTKSV